MQHVLALRLYTSAVFQRLNEPFYKDKNGKFYDEKVQVYASRCAEDTQLKRPNYKTLH